MNTVIDKESVTATLHEVNDLSFKAKIELVPAQHKVDSVLDSVLNLKHFLQEFTEQGRQLNESLERLTWIDETLLDTETLKQINSIINSANGLSRSLSLRYTINLVELRSKGIATEEIEAFKEEIDVLEENCDDLDAIFFQLPSMPDFLDAKEKLAELDLVR